jgi:choline dehydrogenase-like flavoprotein
VLIDLKEYKVKNLPTAKVCILGGGVAGLVLATELSTHLSDIVVLEAGAEQFDIDSQEIYKAEISPEHYPNPQYSRLRFLGGSSNHWENNTSPLSEVDFKNREWINNSGWPISLSDIEPYYTKAAEYCGTKIDGYQTDFWSKTLKKTDVVKNSNVLSTAIAKSSYPPVRFFTKLKSKLVSSQNITIYSNANVIDLNFDLEKQTVNQVIMESTPGKQHIIDADIFVMCFGGIENPRLLLEFNHKYNNSIGNQGDSVGRYFMDHPVVRSAYLHTKLEKEYDLYQWSILKDRLVKGFFQFQEKELEKNKISNIRIPLIPQSNFTLSDGISSFHSLSGAISAAEFPDDLGSHLYNVVSDMSMVIEAVSRKSFDKKIFDNADAFGGYELQVMIEQSPDRNNRIKLGQEKDRFGLRKIIIDWKISIDDKQRMWKGLEVAANEIGALSLGRLRLLREREDRMWTSQLGFGNHHMGTTRMSESPDTGVVDVNQKVFGTNNFYIGGSSVFTTGGHVPPTLTIVAMTIRLAEHIKREMIHE